MAYHTYTYRFDPALYLDTPGEVAVLNDVFTSQGVALPLTLHALRRKGAWASTLPPGVFTGDYRPDSVSMDEHLRARDQLVRGSVEASGRRHHPVPVGQRTVERDGRLFYHAEFIRVLRPLVELPYFLSALWRFLDAAHKDPSLIVPLKAKQRFIPPERRKQFFDLRGNMCRGPGWLPEEDAVLRRWLGQHTSGPDAGFHVPLTPAQWKQLLEVELGGRRTKGSVQARCVFLNKKLADRLMVDGFLPRDSIRLYLSQALGEAPRVPRTQQTRARRRRAA